MKKKTITEKFRPNTIDDLVLLNETKQLLKNLTNQEQCSHILLTGSVGVGKTSTARAISNELDADLLAVNACKVDTDTFRRDFHCFTNNESIYPIPSRFTLDT